MIQNESIKINLSTFKVKQPSVEASSVLRTKIPRKKKGCHGNRHNAIYGRWAEISVCRIFCVLVLEAVDCCLENLDTFFLLEANNKTFQDEFPVKSDVPSCPQRCGE